MKKVDKENWRCGICNCNWTETSSHYLESSSFGIKLCSKHYGQMYGKGKIVDKSKSRSREPRICDICGGAENVGQIVADGEFNGLLMCQRHKMQIYKYGKIFERTMFDKNKIDILDSWAEVTLYDAHSNVSGIAKIDIEDIEKISQRKWTLSPNGYALTFAERDQSALMHRHLTDYDIVDHINRNRLDNRKSNLREATRSENSMNSIVKVNNTSGFIGVYWNKCNSCWRARITLDKKELSKSGFKDKHDAIVQRLKWEKEYFKEFSPQRHLFEEYGIAGEQL